MSSWHVIAGEWSLPGLDPAVTYLVPVESLIEIARDREPVDLPLDQVCYRHEVMSEDRLRECDTSHPCIVADGVGNPGDLRYRLLDGNHRIHKMIAENRRSAPFCVLQLEDFRHLIKRFEEYLPDWPVQPNAGGASGIGGGSEIVAETERSADGTTATAEELTTTARQRVTERRFGRAIELMNRALEIEPESVDRIRYRAWILQIVSRHDEALLDLQKLTTLVPDEEATWQNLAHSLRTMGRHKEAEAALLKALELNPRSADCMADLGTMYRDIGRHEEAADWLQKAVAEAPADAGLKALLGAALLAGGSAAAGREALESAFQINPYDRTTLAYLYIALCQTGDREAALDLTRPELFVRSFQRPGSVDASSDRDDLDHRLATHVRQHPTLQYERLGNTTRGGTHTGNLLEESPGPVAELVAWIEDRVRAYLKSLPMDGSHPYLAWTPDNWDLDVWGIVIQPGGYQESHIHRDGWVSGVYYAAVPESVQTGMEENMGGSLEIGRPPEAFCGSAAFPTQVLRPRPGRVNLFPSYQWHRTLPYESDGERICIAFDIRPRM